MRILLVGLFAAAVLTPAAGAQIYSLHFKDPKHAKSYSKQLFERGGEQVVLVMLKSGITKKPDGSGFTWMPNDRLEFFVQDQDDPSKVSFEVKGDELEVAVKSLVIAIQGDRVDHLTGFMMQESFFTLAKEYERRERELEELDTERKEAGKGSPEWFDIARRKVQALEQLKTWLKETGYLRAANKIERDLLRERKLLDEGTRARIERALGSLKEAPVPEKLEKVAKTAAPGVKYSVQESQHLRIIHHVGVESGRVTALLELGERAIELFKNEYVDPYAGDDFADHVPDDLFQEFFFGTEDLGQYERMMVEYYGGGWGSGKQKEDRLKAQGSRRNIEKVSLAYWKIGENEDLEGIVLHTLGHTLAELHYEIQNGQDWLTEGSGYALSFALLSRNNVNCFSFEPEKTGDGTVAKGPGGTKPKAPTKTTAAVMNGAREVMAEMAVIAGPPMDQLAKKELWAFVNEDMAKSWAWYDWIARKCGKQGQLWLRRSSKIANASQDAFLTELRTMTGEVFEMPPGKDPIAVMEERWREYLRSEYGINTP
ncbi:MAG: hypothetical protein O3A20_09615 [Planctomycetota bacterium]|nr:hypothetical protein [Planctomycetota bacterium]